MLPVICSFGGWELRSYGVLVALAYGVGVAYLLAYRRELRAPGGHIVDLMLGGLAGGALAGRLGAMAFYTGDWSWRGFLTSGFSFFQVFWGALGGFWIVCRLRRLELTRFADYFAVAIPLAHAAGRLGCLLNGCCHGRPTGLPWGVRLDPASRVAPSLAGVALHPTQLYETAAALSLAALLHPALRSRVARNEPHDGSLLLLYLAGYGALRFCLDFLRGDDPGALALGLSTAQWIASAQFILAGAWAARLRNKIVTAHEV